MLEPPSVRVEPYTVRGTTGSRVQVNCYTSGTPKPEISWSKVDGEMPEGMS